MNNYRSIIKTTGLIGGVKIFTLIFNFLKAKVIALFLGPSGMGIYSLFQNFGNVGVAFSDLGMHYSAVFHLAQAKAAGDDNRKNQLFKVLLTSVVGFSTVLAVAICICSKELSTMIFGTPEYHWGMMAIAGYIFCTSTGELMVGILNGMREIKTMAICQICGAGIGGICSCVCVMIFGVNGIAAGFLFFGLSLLVVAARAVFKLNWKWLKIEFKTYRTEFKLLLLTGIVILSSNLFAYLFAYFSGIYIKRTLSMEALGLYQSCWTVSNLYIGMILTAMGADFLPRIMAHINDKNALTQCLNEQIEIGLIFSLPGILITFLFAPLILQILYSAEFTSAAFIIRWQMPGVLLRIMTWPLGYTLIAIGRKSLFVAAQGAFYLGEYVLLCILIHFFGMNALGPVFTCAYILYFAGMFLIFDVFLKYRFSPRVFLLLGGSCLYVLLATGLVWGIPQQLYLYLVGGGLVLVNLIATHLILKKYYQLDFLNTIKRKLLKNA